MWLMGIFALIMTLLAYHKAVILSAAKDLGSARREILRCAQDDTYGLVLAIVLHGNCYVKMVQKHL